METIYRKVSPEKRCPTKTDIYYTNIGKVAFFEEEKEFKDSQANNIFWWLEEIELPSDEEIKNKSKENEIEDRFYKTGKTYRNYFNGAQWMRDFVLAVSPK